MAFAGTDTHWVVQSRVWISPNGPFQTQSHFHKNGFAKSAYVKPKVTGGSCLGGVAKVALVKIP